MRVEAIEVHEVEVPLVAPFRTAHGVESVRRVALVRVCTEQGEGWGEDPALTEPGYDMEYQAASVAALVDHLAPRVVGADLDDPVTVDRCLAGLVGWSMARHALTTALLDARLRASGRSLAGHLGGERPVVTSRVVVGVHDSVADLVATVDGHLAEGYTAVKLKLTPGADLDRVEAVRAHVGDEVALAADANGSYTVDDLDRLAHLDRFGLDFLEQPLPAGDLLGNARVASVLSTPVCLDESITSADAALVALELAAASVLCVKPARVGGLAEAVRIHDLAVERGVPVWCGGMLETGVGRAASLAFASLPGCRLPADLSASSRYVARDVTRPFELVDGTLAVPDGPGLGVAPDPDELARVTRRVHRVEK